MSGSESHIKPLDVPTLILHVDSESSCGCYTLCPTTKPEYDATSLSHCRWRNQNDIKATGGYTKHTSGEFVVTLRWTGDSRVTLLESGGACDASSRPAAWTLAQLSCDLIDPPSGPASPSVAACRRLSQGYATREAPTATRRQPGPSWPFPDFAQPPAFHCLRASYSSLAIIYQLVRFDSHRTAG